MSEREELIDALSGILDCVHPQGVADQAAAALRADAVEIARLRAAVRDAAMSLWNYGNSEWLLRHADVIARAMEEQ